MNVTEALAFAQKVMEDATDAAIESNLAMMPEDSTEFELDENLSTILLFTAEEALKMAGVSPIVFTAVMDQLREFELRALEADLAVAALPPDTPGIERLALSMDIMGFLPDSWFEEN